MRRRPEEHLKSVWLAKVTGRRSRGRQKLRLRDAISRDMKEVGAKENEWEDRTKWRKRCRAADLAGAG